MILLEQITKAVPTPSGGFTNVLSDVTLKIPSNCRIALVGPSPKDQRVLIDLIAGVRRPSAGRIVRKANLSFPIGPLPAFDLKSTLRHNVAHVARIYGADVTETLKSMGSFRPFRVCFDQSFEKIPYKIRSLFTHALAASIGFDTYLFVDDSITRRDFDGGGRKLAEGIHSLFEARWQRSGFIMPTRDVQFAREQCDLALELRDGRLLLLESASLSNLDGPSKKKRLDGPSKEERGRKRSRSSP